MKKMTLEVEVREPGPSRARVGRRAGKVPAIVYGPGKENVAVFVEDVALKKIIHEGGAQALITLEVAGADDGDAEVLTILKDVQYDAFGEKLLHSDFYLVTLGKQLHVTVPLISVGESPGVKAGGILEHLVREIHISCLPKDIPDHVEVHVGDLELNDTRTIADIVVPPGVTILDDRSAHVVSVKPSRIARLADVEAAAAAVAGVEGAPAEEGEAATADEKAEPGSK